jgi:hypothetical protein
MCIKERTNQEAEIGVKRAEKRQKRTEKASDDTTATASMRSKQNTRSIEQIIEF